MRFDNRANDQLRPTTIESKVLINNPNSCLIKYGNTHVICSATIDNSIPPFLRNQNQGWITAEYAMLPRSTIQRVRRDNSQNKTSGRTQEIQRLIGRSLRSAVDLKLLGERQIIIDCDVINADGGTRTASITGGFVALNLAINELLKNRLIKSQPILNKVAAISCGVSKNQILVDLDYNEDSKADVDANFVINDDGSLIEIQCSAEGKPFTHSQLNAMIELASNAAKELFILQEKALNLVSLVV